jgi:hypothetical protein
VVVTVSGLPGVIRALRSAVREGWTSTTGVRELRVEQDHCRRRTVRVTVCIHAPALVTVTGGDRVGSVGLQEIELGGVDVDDVRTRTLTFWPAVPVNVA